MMGQPSPEARWVRFMAIDTAEKRRNVGGNMPTPDSTISIFDRRHVAGNYRGMPIAASVGGEITPTGGLVRVLEAYRGLGGSITPSGDLSRLLSYYRSIGGGLTPTGELARVVTMIMLIGGELEFAGDVALRNPSWLLLDKRMRWMGEWDTNESYEIDDVVLYKRLDGNEWHVFVSKIGHNVGNTPTNSAVAWRRLYQEPLL